VVYLTIFKKYGYNEIEPKQKIGTFEREVKPMSAVSVSLRPLGDRVVVKALAREAVTKSGIVLPDTAKEKPQEGEILAVGPGKVLDNGKRTALEVQAGQRVLFAKYAGTEVKIDGEEYLILRESDIMGIIE
jgi:chaperonin GroES